ncbi:ascBF operon repressor [Klebsiella pneumoniae]|uniref:AscBF operon repressor n=1 Tax=Klebsiella pneumoniae TaxID=573 RepID=A0A378BV61_KLEPN|nr:ascBF operon repressor [Klebsiella pneumoniae]
MTEMIKESINRLIFMLDGGEFNFQQSFPGALIERESLVRAPVPDVVSCHRHY